MRPVYTLMFALCLSALAACGFELRGGQALPPGLGDMRLQGGSEDLYRQLRRVFRLSGGALSRREGAGPVLRVLDERSARRALSVDSAGKALTYGIDYEVEFEVLGADGTAAAPPQRLRLTREYLYAGDDVHGAAREEALLREGMTAEAAERMLRRISRLRAG